MAIPKFKPLANASEKTKKTAKPILMAVIAILLGAFGLTASGNDWDLNKILTGSSMSESKIQTDEEGNLIGVNNANNQEFGMREQENISAADIRRELFEGENIVVGESDYGQSLLKSCPFARPKIDDMENVD